MTNLSDSILTSIASISAVLLSQITILIEDQSMMKAITAISSVVLCLTAIIKLVDLCIEKYRKHISPRFKRKPPNPNDDIK